MACNSKRKQVTLTLLEKCQIIEKLDAGVENSVILRDYKIGRSTLFYIKKKKEEILKYFSSNKRHIKRRTLRRPKQVEFDRILHEWFVAKRNEGVAISGPMLIAKAKSLKEELNIAEDMKFSEGWLRSFKSRHGIRKLTMSGKQRSADTHAASNYCDKFKTIIANYDLTPEDVYNADESGINWKFLPTKTLAGSEEQKIKGFKLNKERLTVMVCANASGTPKHNGDENSDSSHSLDPNVNNKEHSDEAISWDDAEKSMETVIKFLEKSPYFSDNYVLQAMSLQRDIIIKKLQNQEIVDFHDRLRNTMAVPESSIDENRNCNETHSMNK